LEFGNVGFYGERKTGVPGEKPSEQGRKLTTNSTHIRHRDQESRVLSPLRHPCSPKELSFDKDKTKHGFQFAKDSSLHRQIHTGTERIERSCQSCSVPHIEVRTERACHRIALLKISLT